LLDQLVVRIHPDRVQPTGGTAGRPALAPTESGGADSVAPKNLAVVRDLVARVAAGRDCRDGVDADTRVAARSLGWLQYTGSEPPTVTEAGTRLLQTEVGSADELALFAGAVLEHPPFCSIAGALLLGEWLELRDLPPALVRELGLAPAQAARLTPCVLAWRNELRQAGWTARNAALHLRSRTAWMTGLSVRTRDVLARIGVVTRERVLALDPESLRNRQEFRPDTLREIDRFRAELGGDALASPPERVASLVEEASVLLRKLGSFELSGRARRVLRDVGAVCIADVIALDPDALLRQPQCGRTTVDEIVALLAGLELQMSPSIASAVPEPDTDASEEPVPTRARRLVARRGCVSIGALARECADLPEPLRDLDELRRVLSADPDVRWLDDDLAWFWIESGRRAGLLARIDELLRDADEVSPVALRTELLRESGSRSDVPPTAVLAALCEQLGYGEHLHEQAPEIAITTATIGGDSTVAELAEAAGTTVDELVALAISDAGREASPPRARSASRRGRA